MPSLPIVGGDTGSWGTKLNQFLSVAHNADGTWKDLILLVDDTDATVVDGNASEVAL